MSPQQHKIPLAIHAEVMGSFKIVEVIIRDLPWEDKARMQRAGQFDCGKRQYLLPVFVQKLPEPVIDALFRENLINQDSDILEFGSAEFGMSGDPRQDANRALDIICQMAPQFSKGFIDRTIPCSS